MNTHHYSLPRHESTLADGVEHTMNIAQCMSTLASEGVQAWELPAILQTEFGPRCRIPKNTFGGVVQDADTELYIKLHQQAPEGLLQFKSMNTLHRRFTDARLRDLHPWNIFEHEDGSYQIIDQPFYRRKYEALRQARALGRLGVTDTRRLRQMIRRNPPYQLPAF